MMSDEDRVRMLEAFGLSPSHVWRDITRATGGDFDEISFDFRLEDFNSPESLMNSVIKQAQNKGLKKGQENIKESFRNLLGINDNG